MLTQREDWKRANPFIALKTNEGFAIEALLSANLIMPSIALALDLFQNPRRLKATLRF
ncbi:hypothetical protein [Legionella maioricensis]|uniref:Uncharacterized protein n=1 Tax=Legionella maioricensis TaxID=2896528 RepID=A0A9X2D395_9GAMM|nr:hypothetical protein [Legionella maioricensis]MCL9685663.1 hypothetical protein [Legionella maioricensis]MCL9689071.1 hypothetical protein [Legionella maioricensis]